jgi:hypothetical protein
MRTSIAKSSLEASSPETLAGVAISLVFWVCLLLSAVLFAAAALSPKLAAYMQLRDQYETNQFELVTLERQAGQLQRVINAIRSDKNFAAEMTRIELDAARPEEEVIPVEGDLKLDAKTMRQDDLYRDAEFVWYQPIVQILAGDSNLRMGVLATAGLLLVVSFTMLQPGGLSHATSGRHAEGTVWQTVKSRYVQRL